VSATVPIVFVLCYLYFFKSYFIAVVLVLVLVDFSVLGFHAALKHLNCRWCCQLHGMHSILDVYTEMNRVAVFCAVTFWSNVIGYELFGVVPQLNPEDVSSMELWNVRILPHHYMVWQPRRPRLKSMKHSLSWETKSLNCWRNPLPFMETEVSLPCLKLT